MVSREEWSAPMTRHTRPKRARTAASAKQSPRILAIDPGARYMGVAFLVGPELVRAEIEHVREPGMDDRQITEKTQLVLGRWVERYQPNLVAVEQPFFAQSKQSVHLQFV